MRGMTWDHPRGVDPLLAASRAWYNRTGQEIVWDRRSLQDFETYPVEELARQYDLIVIDHPHVGQVADAGCLAPLDTLCTATALAEIEAGSVGLSYPSYRWKGRQWALPIDAATQVQAWVPGRLAAPLRNWDDVVALARAGALALPLRAPHSLMTLFSLCGLDAVPLNVDGPHLFPAQAATAYDRLAQLADLIDPIAYDQDPIAVLEVMGSAHSALAASPFIYGYVSYAQDGFRPTRIAFHDLPVTGAAGPAGSALGGTGLAISASSACLADAAAFAQWVASGPVQTNLFAPSGGQPGHAQAWEDDGINGLTADFYRATRATLDRAWLRPRHTGYMAFQQQASDRLNQALRTREDAASAIVALNTLFARSFG
ncbi:extracellular solute-binding protein [Sphingobium sp. CR2-8]|uniref:extracellular solute-binding protein n=1 Tax=Sphingobium sp. CR2-8 TaxID=1306534 RepID=UPI002DB82D85|nr:extracellular solute-binding protein [Sphingobium sp. CR2-8]MEC3909254.1 extracellular solute-binding protein [Sphingobium sp. CR2-8]